ncbi:MAG TPA: methyltransferase domain-containing protein, partial [bacterium]|nr:methyltransferase domain-containing protein [bacterium]
MSAVPLPVPPTPVAPATEVASCPLCGAAESTRIGTLHDAVWAKPGEFGLARCAKCSAAFLSPRPPRESIRFYYEGLYDADGLKTEEALQHSGVARFLNGLRLGALFRRRRPATGERHLDVGCGVGALLLRVARDTGATAVGVDLDKNAIDSAEAR